MKIIMLGAGSAMTSCLYNTCFLIDDVGKYFLVDGGGGNQIFVQLKKAGVSPFDVRDIFVTHKHMDHLLGVLWMVRFICQEMKNGRYEGDARIYGNNDTISILKEIAEKLLFSKQIQYLGTRLKLIAVNDGEELEINGRRFVFFDIGSEKAPQSGFMMSLDDGKRLVCCGDEPCSRQGDKYAENCDWLMHEAFCLFSESDFFRPYEKKHSTARDACENAERLGVKNLILYHTEESHLSDRKFLYTEEGRKYFSGNIFVPDDLETIEI